MDQTTEATPEEKKEDPIFKQIRDEITEHDRQAAFHVLASKHKRRWLEDMSGKRITTRLPKVPKPLPPEPAK